MDTIDDGGVHARDVRLAFDALAQRHQVFVDMLDEDLYTQRVRNLLLPYLERYADRGPLLEIGCGHGNWTAWIARQGVEIHAFDLSSSMVSLTKQSASQPDLLQMDVERMGIADSQYSLLLAIGDVLSYVGSLGATLRELRRVARPRGILVGTVISTGGVLIKELAQHNYASVHQLARNGLWVERTVEELQVAQHSSGKPNDITGPLRATTFTSERLRKVLRQAPATILTLQGVGVLSRLGTEESGPSTPERLEIENLLGQRRPWMDMSTNLFFAVRFTNSGDGYLCHPGRRRL